MGFNCKQGFWVKISLIAVMLTSGCRGPVHRFEAWRDSKDIAYFQNFAHQIEYPDVEGVQAIETVGLPLPLSINNPSELPT
ncbi:MAG: hypothetical protein ACK53L_35720, partial [Pirellulaceae bacterium]